MHLQLRLDLSQAQVSIEIACQSDDHTHEFELVALTIGNGIQVADLKVMLPDAIDAPYSQSESRLTIPHSDFILQYRIKTDYESCVGADMLEDFVYPFTNTHEIFLGTGALAYPTQLEALAINISCQLEVIGLRAGWQWFSNMQTDFHPIMLQGFFFYAALGLPVHRVVLQKVELSLAKQINHTFPIHFSQITAWLEACLLWLEANLLPHQASQHLNILLLQAENDFFDRAHQRSFATGENFYQGIVTYAPNDALYLEQFFGHQDYSFFIFDGLIHELFHFYASSNWQGRYKSVIYPPQTASPYQAKVMGEALTVYLHKYYISQVSGYENHFERYIQTQLKHWQARRQRNVLLDLLRFDRFLKQHDLSLFALCRQLLYAKHQTHAPSTVADWFEILERHFQVPVPADVIALFDEHVEPNYAGL